jgi:phage-related protein
LLLLHNGQRDRQHCVPARGSQFVAFPLKASGGHNRGDGLEGIDKPRWPIFHAAAQLKIVQLNLPRYQGH